MKTNACTLTAVAAIFLTSATYAQAPFPTKPVRLIVPFAPGGSADNSARLLAELLSVKWKHVVVVENKPGANATVGAAQAARAPADGYTIFYTPVSIGTVNLFVKDPGFDPLKDLLPVSLVASGDYVVNVQKDLPVNTIAEFADYARKHPGVTHGSFGGGSMLAFAQLGEKLNFEVTDVPYRGESPALTALVGGQIQAMFSTLAAAMPFMEGGRIKTLGLTSKNRSPVAPNVKSADESGAAGYYVDFWFGLTVPRGTPASIINTINADVKAVLSQPEVKDRYIQAGLKATPTTPAEFGDLIKFESERWVATAKRLGLKPQ